MAKKKAARRPSKPARKAARTPARKTKAPRAKSKTTRRASAPKQRAATRPSAKKAAAKRVARKSPAKKAPARKAPPKKLAARKAPTKAVVKVAAKPSRKVAARTATQAAALAYPILQAVKAAAPKVSGRPKRPPSLDRTRKIAGEPHGVPSSLDSGSFASAAKSGQAELQHKLKQHSSSSPALTAGDVDADWESADSTGDEAPGGDNPTPDQDVVDEIGRALGVEYADDEELQGGDEIAERDRHRWELDPNSKDDFEDTE